MAIIIIERSYEIMDFGMVNEKKNREQSAAKEDFKFSNSFHMQNNLNSVLNLNPELQGNSSLLMSMGGREQIRGKAEQTPMMQLKEGGSKKGVIQCWDNRCEMLITLCLSMLSQINANYCTRSLIELLQINEEKSPEDILEILNTKDSQDNRIDIIHKYLKNSPHSNTLNLKQYLNEKDQIYDLLMTDFTQFLINCLKQKNRDWDEIMEIVKSQLEGIFEYALTLNWVPISFNWSDLNSLRAFSQPIVEANSFTDIKNDDPIFEPKSQNAGFLLKRMGNSNTLEKYTKKDPKILNNETEFDKFKNEKEIGQWLSADAYMREEASKNKEKEISGAKLCEIAININQLLLPEAETKALRGKEISFDGNNALPLSFVIPILASTFDKIAKELNDISDKSITQNNSKSRAISIAAYTYKSLIYIHPFNDANGRTCRLMSDFILLIHKLPPAMPDKYSKFPKDIGKSMNNNKGKCPNIIDYISPITLSISNCQLKNLLALNFIGTSGKQINLSLSNFLQSKKDTNTIDSTTVENNKITKLKKDLETLKEKIPEKTLLQVVTFAQNENLIAFNILLDEQITPSLKSYMKQYYNKLIQIKNSEKMNSSNTITEQINKKDISLKNIEESLSAFNLSSMDIINNLEKSSFYESFYAYNTSLALLDELQNDLISVLNNLEQYVKYLNNISINSNDPTVNNSISEYTKCIKIYMDQLWEPIKNIKEPLLNYEKNADVFELAVFPTKKELQTYAESITNSYNLINEIYKKS